MIKYLFLLACAACGGAFSDGDSSPDAARRTELPDAHNTHDMDHIDPRPDAAPDGPRPEDAHTPPEDVMVLPDRVVPPDAFTDTGCPSFPVATVVCPGGIGSTTPTTYCVYESTEGTSMVATTPDMCTCTSTYTCTCLVASVTIPSDLCASGQIYGGCEMIDGAPLVTCETP